jgi:hypothetical protein
MEGQAFAISNILMGIVLVLWSAIIGLAVIAFGQLLLAIREVAHNTRKEGVHGAHYNILLIVAKINNLLGWLVIGLGVILGVYLIIAGHPIILQTQIPANPPI